MSQPTPTDLHHERVLALEGILRDILRFCEQPDAGFRTNRLRNIRDLARKGLIGALRVQGSAQ